MVARLTTVVPVVGVGAAKPVLRVSVVVPTVAASSVQPVFTATASVASAVTTYAIPAAAISYIALATGAYLDTTGRFQLVLDSITCTDGRVLSFSKRLTDATTLADVITHKEVEKSILGDFVALAEDFVKVLIFIRAYADSVGLSDAAVLSLIKLAVDSVTASDAVRLAPALGKADSISAVDGIAKDFSKPRADSANATDAATRAVDKVLADAASTVDAAYRVVDKVLADAAVIIEQPTLSFFRNLADGVAMSDSFDAGDGLLYTFSKGISNVTMVADATSKTVQRASTDTVSTSDSGFVLMQDYCDPAYFLEDYVGQARIF